DPYDLRVYVFRARRTEYRTFFDSRGREISTPISLPRLSHPVALRLDNHLLLDANLNLSVDLFSLLGLQPGARATIEYRGEDRKFFPVMILSPGDIVWPAGPLTAERRLSIAPGGGRLADGGLLKILSKDSAITFIHPEETLKSFEVRKNQAGTIVSGLPGDASVTLSGDSIQASDGTVLRRDGSSILIDRPVLRGGGSRVLSYGEGRIVCADSDGYGFEIDYAPGRVTVFESKRDRDRVFSYRVVGSN
ncbi:MAG: hypothetical protein RIF32_11005, partial [Leptospirales bacterium]